MTDIVKVKQEGIQVFPQTHWEALEGKPTLLKGDKGDAATITVGTVTSGTTAAVTNAGTSSAARFNFILPKGDKGDPGQNATTTTPATTTANGLMAAADKVKLNAIESGAQKNPSAATQTTAGLMSAADKKKLDGLSNSGITFEKVGEV
ncbi:hypothetical protein [Enterococcus pallens]|uniref:Uncharacterized protein n=1 Tax=Enterococcus pallens ATCC BAA-351 TaxID=1158607 RepID=R2SML0_9ENTE|nr:hypothetical protein [Enterococcus pallens]EOH96395.1 hypothetical protein UAU_01046 [Enterococcus pallens ATCC BAA-351]EOU14392.1 hypothetical protein I588_04748 [Enterococcus pallens ATCC BAA-351]OJG77303.1 hypothetical protein RV10_GL002560 [Enterococcus pallens]